LRNSIALFFLSPLLGVIQAFKHFRETWAKDSIWLFVIFYGYTMFRPENNDSSGYVAKLTNLYNTPLNWNMFAASFYSEDSNVVDIYEPLITFVLSLFTKDGNILFAVFGLVYGYFFSRNIWMVLDLSQGRKVDRGFWILIVTFICALGYWNLNGVRMWTAAHVFFYGAFQYLVHNRKKGILIAVSSFLFHFSFVLPVGVLLFFVFFRIPWRFLYFGFLASFFLSSLQIGFVREKLESVAPTFLLPRVESYTNDEYVEVISDMNESTNWYIKYYLKTLMWAIVLLFTLIYFSKEKKFKSDNELSNLFGFSLLMLTIGNITAILPSGGRYIMVANLFAVAVLVYYYVRIGNVRYSLWVNILSIFFLFFIIMNIRISLETTSVMTIFGNPIFAAIFDLSIPLVGS
jgi:hypothetical protein